MLHKVQNLHTLQGTDLEHDYVEVLSDKPNGDLIILLVKN